MNIFTSKIKMLKYIKILEDELQHEYERDQYYQNKINNLKKEIEHLRKKYGDYSK